MGSTPHTTHSSFTLAVCMTSPPAPALPSTTACWPSATATTTGSSRTPGARMGRGRIHQDVQGQAKPVRYRYNGLLRKGLKPLSSYLPCFNSLEKIHAPFLI